MAKRDKKPPKQEPKWKMVEKVVSLVERMLDPQATVEHNVFLPDLQNPPHERQCDVVVTTGPQHRPTRTIVEVQRRGKKVEVLVFDGWVAKMSAIGAQHLVCVSTMGYPKSVIDKAAKLGPTVRLVTLKELESGSRILEGSFGAALFRQVGTTNFFNVDLKIKDPARVRGPLVGPKQHEPSFRGPDGEVLSLNQVAQRLVNNDPRVHLLGSGTHRMSYETLELLEFLPDPSIGPVRVTFDVDVVVHADQVACEVREYKQEGDALAWALIGECPRHGSNRMHQMSIIFRPGNDGRLVPRGIYVEGLEPGDIFSSGAGPYTAGPVLVQQRS